MFKPLPSPDEASRLSSYQYSRLDPARHEIRILRVAAGQGNEAVQCSVCKVSLLDSDRPQYEAISYVWGNPATVATINLDGMSRIVPASCEEALRRMRIFDEDRLLWIDAVCINQQDLTEKGEQVARMDEIYSHSTRTLVWLGHGSIDAETIEALHSFLREAKVATNDFQIETLTSTPRTNSIPKSHTPRAAAIFDSPWFGRLWVVQEAILAPDCLVHLTNHDFPFSTIVRVGWWLAQNSLYFWNSSRGASNVRAMFWMSEVDPRSKQSGLQYCMNYLQEFATLDPRDHVYGVLGLAKRLSRHGTVLDALRPDYTRPVVDVLRDGTVAAIQQEQSLAILARICHRGTGKVDQSSSWVPQWHRAFDADEDAVPMPGIARADNQIPLMLADADTADLFVGGCMTDETASFTRIAQNHIRQDYNKLAELLREAESLAEGLMYKQTASEVLSRTLVANFSATHMQPLQGSEDVEAYTSYRRSIINGQLRTYAEGVALGETIPELSFPQYLADTRSMFRNRRLFRTSAGRLGLGPQTMEEGDQGSVSRACNTSTPLTSQSWSFCTAVGIPVWYDRTMTTTSSLGCVMSMALWMANSYVITMRTDRKIRCTACGESIVQIVMGLLYATT